MTKPLLNSFLFFTIFSIFFFFQFILISIQGNELEFGSNLNPKEFGIVKEKLTHFKVYWQDFVSGLELSTSSGFQDFSVFDNALTSGPEINSKLVGHAQGIFAPKAQTEIGLLMPMNFVFVEGKYNGSTISINGRNEVSSQAREMPIIGGSGIFRFASGYVEAKTHKIDMETGHVTLEYNVYVLHY